MPYKSQAQAAFFNKNRKKLEKQGVNVDEWDEASKGKKLPKHVKPAPAPDAPKTRPRFLDARKKS
jgi:hypothetical protein